MICDILFALLLSCIMVEQLVYRLPFLDFASVKQTDNQLLIRSVHFPFLSFHKFSSVIVERVFKLNLNFQGAVFEISVKCIYEKPRPL